MAITSPVSPTRPKEETPVGGTAGGFAGPPVAAARPPAVTLPAKEEPKTEEPQVEGDASGVAGLEGMQPEFARRLAALIKQTGGQVYVTSGYRSEGEQARLYQNALAKYGSPQAAGKWVAPPGKSNHGKGTAADLGGNLALAKQLAPSFGLHFPMGHEPWHIEPVNVRQDPATPREAYTDPTTKDKPPTPAETMAHIADTILTDASSRIQTPSQSFADPAMAAERPPDISLPQEEEEAGAEAPEGDGPEAWIRQAMKIEGVGEDWYPGLYRRMMQESGGRNIPQGIVDINTQKGTPAFGPMQVIEPTFRSNMREGYGDWKNPLHNTIAAIRYIRSRYGHPDRLPRGGY